MISELGNEFSFMDIFIHVLFDYLFFIKNATICKLNFFIFLTKCYLIVQDSP